MRNLVEVFKGRAFGLIRHFNLCPVQIRPMKITKRITNQKRVVDKKRLRCPVRPDHVCIYSSLLTRFHQSLPLILITFITSSTSSIYIPLIPTVAFICILLSSSVRDSLLSPLDHSS